jgi:very-short-patch-repair endonuclease
MMINNALLNGEGPNFSSASVGIEAMIQRLTTFREQITDWLENSIYIPEARRQGFLEKNEETGEEEVIIPKIKWNSMHLRDQQQYRTFVMQLYEKGLLSAQTVLEVFDFDPDQEIERKRYDALQMAAMGGAQGGGAPPAGGMGGGGGGMGGLPPPSGGGDMGAMGGEPPIAAGGAEGGDAGGGAPAISKSSSLNVDVADPSQYGGRVLKKKTREKLSSEQQRQQRMYEQQQQKVLDASSPQGTGGTQRDEKGRIIFTKCERTLMPLLLKARQDGLLGSTGFVPQYRVSSGDSEYAIDFAFPSLKIGVEADGEMFHSTPKQIAHDKERDMKLGQQGWTILRFNDTEIEKRSQQVLQQIIKTVMQKQLQVQNLASEKPQN